MTSSGSFQLEKRPEKSGKPIAEGGKDEKRIRLLQGPPQPLRGTAEASSDNPFGPEDDPVLQGSIG